MDMGKETIEIEGSKQLMDAFQFVCIMEVTPFLGALMAGRQLMR
jgi:hypothetical protein